MTPDPKNASRAQPGAFRAGPSPADPFPAGPFPAGPSQAGPSHAGPSRSGPGRLLVAVYGLFALAACSRAGVQLATRFSEAPTAYLLSAVAGVIYVVATITLARDTRVARRVALAAILVELVGVLVVGTLSLVDPAAFPRATVWSAYGIGYGFIPLLLPVAGLWWLGRTRRGAVSVGAG